MADCAALDIEQSIAWCTGPWTLASLDGVERELSTLEWPADRVQFNLARLSAIDSIGAWLLHRTMRDLEAHGREVSVVDADARAARLLQVVADHAGAATSAPKPPQAGPLESIGRHSSEQLSELVSLLGFLGEMSHTVWRSLRQPKRIRVALIIREIESAGVNALPIVGLLAFLLGIVIAYQGGIVLRDYGANIYVADIVGLSTVRELAPLITAIIVGGRTGSAYTAQIGTMKVTEEIDALRSIGISPMELLVLPKLLALAIALPLLTVFADLMGLAGGLVMSQSMLNLTASTYLDRLADALTLDSFLSGVGKAPVFAAIIATVGCFQGFRVFGGAASVGKQTTTSVVQAIFLVLVVDALFSVAFSKLGI